MSDDYIAELRNRYSRAKRYESPISKALIAPDGYEYGWKTWYIRVYDTSSQFILEPSAVDIERTLADGWHPVGYLEDKWDISRNGDGYFACSDAVLCMRHKVVEAAPLEGYSEEDLLEELAVRLAVKSRVKQPSTIEQMLPALQVASELESGGKSVSRADHELAWKAATEGIADIPENMQSEWVDNEWQKVNAKPYIHEVRDWEDEIWKPIMESMDEKLEIIRKCDEAGIGVVYERFPGDE